MIDYQQIQIDYAKAYADKSRIFFIEKYFSTFNQDTGKNSPFILFPRQKVFLKSLAENPATIAIKHRQCRNYNNIICLDCSTNGVFYERKSRSRSMHCEPSEAC